MNTLPVELDVRMKPGSCTSRTQLPSITPLIMRQGPFMPIIREKRCGPLLTCTKPSCTTCHVELSAAAHGAVAPRKLGELDPMALGLAKTEHGFSDPSSPEAPLEQGTTRLASC
mmetsp:Transcript_16176/g.47191  ORF Transcript_16176/g.47191 Transcript_16176/m.47191 type:complete len:114 (+) Transcript_16176:1292-1633(+)